MMQDYCFVFCKIAVVTTVIEGDLKMQYVPALLLQCFLYAVADGFCQRKAFEVDESFVWSHGTSIKLSWMEWFVFLQNYFLHQLATI